MKRKSLKKVLIFSFFWLYFLNFSIYSFKEAVRDECYSNFYFPWLIKEDKRRKAIHDAIEDALEKARLCLPKKFYDRLMSQVNSRVYSVLRGRNKDDISNLLLYGAGRMKSIS